jgi:hypothetical protein
MNAAISGRLRSNDVFSDGALAGTSAAPTEVANSNAPPIVTAQSTDRILRQAGHRKAFIAESTYESSNAPGG